MTIAVDTSHKKTFIVGDADTAIALGSGDVPVLGTPRLVAWCEEVTVLALGGQLEQGHTSVGFRIAIEHRAPTAVGGSVEVSANVSSVEGRQVTLAVRAAVGGSTGGEPVYAEGTITRVVVDRDRFIAGLT